MEDQDASKRPPQERRPPLAVGLEWASRVTVICALMVLPGIAGWWLDERWGTDFLVLVGFAFGLVAGVVQLLLTTGAFGPGQKKRSQKNSESKEAERQ